MRHTNAKQHHELGLPLCSRTPSHTQTHPRTLRHCSLKNKKKKKKAAKEGTPMEA
jgi:hypothetical protein